MKKLPIFLPILLLGCASLKPLPRQLLTCEEEGFLTQLPALSQQASAFLQAPSRAEALAGLDALAIAQGPAAICAISAVVADLEAAASNSPSVAAAGKVALSVQLSRACEWQAAQGFRAKAPVARPLLTHSL